MNRKGVGENRQARRVTGPSRETPVAATADTYGRSGRAGRAAQRASRGRVRTGNAHPKWKGGVGLNEKGYLRITAGPLRNIFVHRLIGEALAGRPLREDEEVHHIDGDRLNCHPSNLEVMPGHRHDAIERARQKLRAKQEKQRASRESINAISEYLAPPHASSHPPNSDRCHERSD